jgi:hypothetical protein
MAADPMTVSIGSSSQTSPGPAPHRLIPLRMHMLLASAICSRAIAAQRLVKVCLCLHNLRRSLGPLRPEFVALKSHKRCAGLGFIS